MMPSGMSHSPCQSHTLHATITCSLLCSCFLAKDSKLGSAQLIQKCSSFLLKVKPKQWPNLNLDYFLHASSHILEISLAHVNNVKSLWLTWSSCERPMWIFLIMLLVIGPWYGLGLADAPELGLVGVTSSFPLEEDLPSKLGGHPLHQKYV